MFEFKMPSLGADMTAGTLTEWKIKPGDRVKRGQIVAVVDTEKAAIDMEIWVEGLVEKILIEPGQKVPVGTTLAILSETGLSEKLETNVSQPARQRISPFARQRAEALGVDLTKIQGSGAQGAIEAVDVETAAIKTPSLMEEHFSMRQAIAAAMSRSKREIPHYYLSSLISISATKDWLERENEKRPITSRILLSALYIKAVAKACVAYPEFNGFWKNDRFEPATAVNIGMAVSLRNQGLIAPALLNVERRSLEQVMEELLDLVARAKSGGLRSSELTDSTITLTNLGDLGVDQVFGVIYPPQVALVGIGRISEKGSVMVSLSGDHRATDGARGARFLTEIGKLLEKPELL